MRAPRSRGLDRRGLRAGTTWSSNFPVLNAYQTTDRAIGASGGGGNVFVTKLNPDSGTRQRDAGLLDHDRRNHRRLRGGNRSGFLWGSLRNWVEPVFGLSPALPLTRVIAVCRM